MRKLFLILGGLFLMGSCSTELEKYNKKLEECFEDKQKELDTEYADMDEAIAEFEFDIAHKFLGCYTSKEWYDSDAREYIKPRKDAINRLVKAEVMALIKQLEFKQALDVYDELVTRKIDEGLYVPDKLEGSVQRYQIFYEAVYHYIEDDNIPEATKWAKRAPSNVSVEGYLLKSWEKNLFEEYGKKPVSQMEQLLKEIENY